MASRVKMLLDPSKKPLCEIASFLSGKIRRTPSGALSLAHLLVVTPTVQSSRRLREEIARRFGAVIAPDVRTPARLVELNEDTVASPTLELVAMCEALRSDATSNVAATFDVAAGYIEVRRIIGANAYEFCDIYAMAAGGKLFHGDMADVEIERWRKFAATEDRYHLALAKYGKTDRMRAVKEALRKGIRFEGIEEIVVAAVLEPLPLAEKAFASAGLPVTELVPATPDDGFSVLEADCVLQAATPAEEARAVAGIFASVKEDEALPSLCVADGKMFTEVQGALAARGIELVNPAETPLSSSSLAQTAMQMAMLERTRSYDVFSSFIRSGDARRWIMESLGFDEAKMTAAIIDLDNRQRQLLPATIDDIAPKTSGPLRAVFEFVMTSLRKKNLRSRLESVFSGFILDEKDPKAREFASAATAVASLVEECFSAGLERDMALDLFARRLADSTYSLEDGSSGAAVADGWLEIPYLDSDELIVCGFQEGCVPQNTAGHPFVPDSLREALGLPCNTSRAKRDLAILNMALLCRKKGAVKVSFHSLDAQGETSKPSRLLFACRDDADFTRRVRRFYSGSAGTKEVPSAAVPEGWKLRLAVPAEYSFVAKTSPSSLDSYMSCPFTWYLKRTFTEGEEYGNEELDASEYGHLVHDALEMWAKGDAKDSSDAELIASQLAASVDAILHERFGGEIPAIVALQGESAKRRLACFSRIQAAWRQQGWRIIASEGKLSYSLARDGGLTLVSGRSDRIDYNDRMDEWCVIDYKTWDSADRASAYDSAKKVWKSLQLPLYCAMLDADRSEFAAAKRDRIKAVYCVIGKTAEETLFSEPISGALVPEAEMAAKEILSRMDRGIFWPAAKNGQRFDWQFRFADWFREGPESEVAEDWIADQKRRLGA